MLSYRLLKSGLAVVAASVFGALQCGSIPLAEYDPRLPAVAYFGEGNDIPRWRLVPPGRTKTTLGAFGLCVGVSVIDFSDTESFEDVIFRGSCQGGFAWVNITRPMYVQTWPVTRREWGEIFELSSYERFERNDDKCLDDPKSWLGWHSALAYANALSVRDGFPPCYSLKNCSGTPGIDFVCDFQVEADLDCSGYRVPTIAELEYLAEGNGRAVRREKIDETLPVDQVHLPDGPWVPVVRLPNGFGLYYTDTTDSTFRAFDYRAGLMLGEETDDPLVDSEFLYPDRKSDYFTHVWYIDEPASPFDWSSSFELRLVRNAPEGAEPELGNFHLPYFGETAMRDPECER